jgi:hypothetical protein
MVAISGAIMPAPLAMPLMTTSTSPIATRAVATLGKVSVVMIARAASIRPSGLALAASLPRTAAILPLSSGSPITPVEAMNISAGAAPVASPAALATWATALAPMPPVKALALPELTTKARARPCARFWRHQSTGAEGHLERVNTPAAAAGASKRASITSVRPA